MLMVNPVFLGSDLFSVRRKAIGAASSAVLAWSLATLLAKWIALDGVTLAFYRMWLGAAGTILLLYMRGGRLTRDVILVSVPGGLALAADSSLFFMAVKLTTVSNAAVIASLIPLPILLVAPWMFGERVNFYDLGWVAAALFGVALGVYGSSGTPNWNPVGDLLALGAMLSFAGYFIASKRARQSASALQYLSAIMLVGAIAVTPGALIFGGGLYIDSVQVFLGVVLLALVLSIGHLLINWAHPHLELWITATLTSTMPIVAALGAVVIFDEPIVLWQALGMFLVVVSVARVAVRTGHMDLGNEVHGDTYIATGASTMVSAGITLGEDLDQEATGSLPE